MSTIATRPSVSRKRAVQHSVQRLRDVGVEAIAAVINDVPASSLRYRSYGPYQLYRQQARSYFTNDDASARS